MRTLRSTTLVVAATAGAGRDRQAEPVTVGIPFPAGLFQDPNCLALADDQGAPVPLQATATDRWTDGSLRWSLLDFQVTGPWKPERRYTLHVLESPRAPIASRLTVNAAADAIEVRTGVATFVMQRGRCFPFSGASINGSAGIDAAASRLCITDVRGRQQVARISRVWVEAHGALRTTVGLEGTVGRRATSRLNVIASVHFFAESAAVRIDVTLQNPRRARHRGGFWELGDVGSIYLRDASVHLALPSTLTSVECAAETGAAFAAVDAPLELYQDSSGGENWRHVNHLNRFGELPQTFSGYRLKSRNGRVDGLRATPAVIVRHEHGSAGIAVEHFWQNCPKAITVRSRALIFHLFPGQWADCHELQGGEQKTHTCALTFGDDPLARDARHWGRTPSTVSGTPAWYCETRAVPYVSPASDDADDRYQRLVNACIDGPDSLVRKREAIDEYGWRDFGDIYADHENAFSGQATPIVSHYNNQYDAIAGFGYQFVRTGDYRWHQLMNELAAHVRDIDIYHTDRDKSAYNHGLFWHTSHYVAAGRCSHRSFPRSPRVHGGGPANEHNYTAGLRLHWLLTGDRQSRDAAIELAGWVMAMDDGRKSILRWLSSADTGLASCTYSPEFHGPGRGAGHSILALLDGHRLSHDERFLAKAEQLIRRCIHPSDEIAALNLLDAERRWSYTVFLQALGKYLDYKAELGQIDSPYAYARSALLHYARWMADHEYPYLAKPEILEFPTETWAAQDMRKCEVFLFAAGHSSGAERDRYIERSRFFFDDSVSTLLQSDTRARARPLVLLLSNGPMALASEALDVRPAVSAVLTDAVAQAHAFVSQKARAKKTLAATAAAVFALALAGLMLA